MYTLVHEVLRLSISLSSLRVSWHRGVSNEFVMQAWKDWFDTEAPEDMTIPDNYSTSLSTFHKLLLIRSWCPDRTIPMAKVNVAEVMGKQVLPLCLLYKFLF